MDKDQALDDWYRKIPHFGSERPLNCNPVKEFSQTCHQLNQLHDVPITHPVIAELASEGGLTRVAELVEPTELQLSLTYVPSEQRHHVRYLAGVFVEHGRIYHTLSTPEYPAD